jgi:uncharacterized protein (TIGR02996 family)
MMLRMSADPERRLLESLAEDLSDDARWAVYADWLSERGDARGDQITAELNGGPPMEGDSPHPPPGAQLTTRWWRGHWRELILSMTGTAPGSLEGVELVRTILGHPSARFLSDLTIGELWDDRRAGENGNLDVVLDELPRLGLLSRTLLKLTVGAAQHGKQLYWSVDLGRVLAQLPALEILENQTRTEGKTPLPRGHGLVGLLVGGGFIAQPGLVQALASAHFPRLVELGLDLYDDYDDALLARALDPENFPSLRELRLQSTHWSVIKTLVTLPILGQLKVLDLADGKIESEAFGILTGCTALDGLEVLDLSRNKIDPDSVDRFVERLKQRGSKCRVVGLHQRYSPTGE